MRTFHILFSSSHSPLNLEIFPPFYGFETKDVITEVRVACSLVPLTLKWPLYSCGNGVAPEVSSGGRRRMLRKSIVVINGGSHITAGVTKAAFSLVNTGVDVNI
jgi:hypothetical protein